MIDWNREAASIIQLLVVLLFFVLLLIKNKKLGKGIFYFIAASAIIVSVDTYVYFARLYKPQLNTIPFYVIGVNLSVFFLFFIYFRHVLVLEKSKKINLILIYLFITSYFLFAIFSKDFFTRFPYIFYFIELILLLGNIYLVLHETFNSDKILNIKSYYPFWACIGVMAIYLGVTPLLIISNTSLKMMNINIFLIILFIVNVIGYSILITGIFYAQNINLKK